MNSPTRNITLKTAAQIALFFASACFAQAQTNYTWDGNGSPNTGGDWTTANLWNVDGVPGGNVLDTATLGNVTAGTRDVTLSAAETIAAFTLTQTTAAVVNKFTLTNTLTTTTHTFSNVSAANVGTSLLELGTNGNFTTGGFNFTGTVNFTGNGSAISKFNGGNINLGNGNNGAITVDVGSGNTATIARTVITNSAQTVAVLGSATNVASLDVKTGTLLISGAASSNFGGASVLFNTGIGATTTVRDGAQVRLESGAASGTTNSTAVTLNNNASGTFNHSGALSFRNQNNIAAGTQIINNASLYTIGSNTASIIRSSGGSTNAASVVTFNNNATGTVTSAGGGAASSLTFTNNNGGSGALTKLALNNLGTIAVGGTSTSGLTGVGTFTLVNTNLATSAANANTISFQIGGSTSGTFDSLTLDTGSIVLASSADTLTLSLVNSFSPSSDFTLSLLSFVNGSTKSGAFDFVTGIGAVSASSNLDVSAALGGSGWTFNNDSSTANFGLLSYAAVPEPSTFMMLLGGFGVLIALQRRGSRAV